MMMTMMAMIKRAIPRCRRNDVSIPKILLSLLDGVFEADGELERGAEVNDLTGYFIGCGLGEATGACGGGFCYLGGLLLLDPGATVYYFVGVSLDLD
jgi:hypothetical protein